MDIMIIIILLILTGYLSKYLKILKEQDRTVLNNIVVYIAMPSTIFLTIMSNVSPSDLPQYIKLPFLIFITFALCGGIGYIIGNLLKLNKESLGGLILVCGLANTGFLGYPIIYGFYGSEGLSRAIFCDIGGVLTSLLFGTYVGITFGKSNIDKNKNVLKSVIKELLKFPPLMTALFSILLISLGISISNIPEFFTTTISYLSNATIPLIMISLGLSLSPSSAKFGIKYGIIATIVRMGIAPLIILGSSIIFSIDGLDKNVLLLESAMPSAMMALVFAVLYNLDVKLVASACFITTVSSFVILPIIYNLL